ncbi:MAG: hypothetical protein GEV04_21275, partial [Actinophytocola sp.]|nr:hypothetical protein [Actinophytocola sp.]
MAGSGAGGWCAPTTVGEDRGMSPRRPRAEPDAARPYPTEELPRAGVVPWAPRASGLPTAAEWARLERGVAQRVRTFEAFLADIYGTGDARVLSDGVLPRRLVTTSERFRREAVGIAQPVRVVIASIDVARDEHGTFRVVADNLCCPAWPAHVAPHLLRALRAMARASARDADQATARGADPATARGADPVVVALAPGDSALARQRGVAAVTGRDLV